MRRVIFLIFILFLSTLTADANSYKIVKVVDGNTFYIDLNGNHKADNDEVYHLKGIVSFASMPSDILKQQSKANKLTEKEILGLSYLARWFARRELQYNNVYPKFNNEGILTSLAYYKNNQYKVYEREILKEGLALTDVDYLGKYIDKCKFEEQKKLTHKFKLVYLDKRKGVYFPLNTKIEETKNIEIIDENYFKRFFQSKPQCQKGCKQYRFNDIQLKTSDVNLYFTDPTIFQRPQRGCHNDNCAVVVNLINNAKSTIKFAIYGYSGEKEILEAINNAEKRGVKVYGIVDMDIKGHNVYPETPILLNNVKNIHTDYESDKKANEIKIQKLKQLELEDPTQDFDIRSAIMHNKFFVVDERFLWTGSTNVTENCMSYNSNVSIVINSPKLAKIYENEFNQMYFEGRFHESKQDSTDEKKNIKINDNTIASVYFSPQDKAITNAIIPLIDKAENYIYTPIFYLTHKGIIESLLNAKNRGVDVKVIIDANSAANKYSKHHLLRENGIEVKTENWGGKMHMKSLAADDKYLVIASMNWTNSAENTNDENTIVVENKDLALQFKKEFLNLWNSIPDKWLTKDPKAESFDSVNSCFDGVDNNHNGVYDFDERACGSVIYDKINSYYQNRNH